MGAPREIQRPAPPHGGSHQQQRATGSDARSIETWRWARAVPFLKCKCLSEKSAMKEDVFPFCWRLPEGSTGVTGFIQEFGEVVIPFYINEQKIETRFHKSKVHKCTWDSSVEKIHHCRVGEPFQNLSTSSGDAWSKLNLPPWLFFLKLTYHPKHWGWKVSFLSGNPIFRGELLVLVDIFNSVRTAFEFCSSRWCHEDCGSTDPWRTCCANT